MYIINEYFTLVDFVFLKNSTVHLRNLIEQWCKPFIINNFDRNHGASYILKILSRQPASNTHHDEHLRIFFMNDIYGQLIKSCFRLHTTCAFGKSRIEVVRVFFICYKQIVPQIIICTLFYADCFLSPILFFA